MNASTSATYEPSRAESTATPGMGPAEFLRILRRRRTLIVLTIGLITGLAGLALSQVTPLYKSQAVAIVEMPDSSNDDPAAAVAFQRENEIQITAFLQLLQSRNVAAKVVHDLALQDDREFNPSADSGRAVPEAGLIKAVKDLLGLSKPPVEEAKNGKSPTQLSETEVERVVDRLVKNIEITQINKSNLLGVTAYSIDAKKAQRIANKVIAVAMEAQIVNREQSNARTIQFLSQRVDELGKQLIAADGKVAAYRKANGIPEGPSTQIQIDQLTSELASARSQRVESEARARSAMAGGSSSAVSPILTDLQNQEITLQRRVAELSGMYGDGHPDMITAKSQLATVQKRLAAEASRVSSSMSSGLAAETSARRASESQIAGSIGALRAQTFQQGVANVQLMNLQRDADTSRTLYVSLLTRLKELQRENQSTSSDARFETRASLPMSTSYPATQRIIGVAFVASLIIAAILAFAAEAIDGRVRTSDQVERLTGSPALAMIPEIPSSWGDLPPYVAIVERPCSAFSEAIRSLQLELAARQTDKAAHVVVVTSPLPGEGKTTLSMALAAAGAATGTDAVIVDLDLRRPGLKSMAGEIATGPDLLDFLDNRASINEILRSDPRVPNLSMIGVKRAARDPGAALTSARMPVLIGELARRFKFIILNTAPVLPVRDAKLLASYADDVLIIAHWGRTPPDALRTASRILGDKLTGALLNRVDYKKHAKLAYGDAIEHYSKYSVYYGDDTRNDGAADDDGFGETRHVSPLKRLLTSLPWSKAA